MSDIRVARHAFSFQRTKMCFIQDCTSAWILTTLKGLCHNLDWSRQKAVGQGVQAWRCEAYIQVRRSEEMRGTTHRLSFLRSRSGFSYLGVLILVAVMSVSLIGAGRYWSTAIKREHEAELLFRGDQIHAAIASYYNHPPQGQKRSYPRQFSDLLKDPRFPNITRHLRKWYADPMNPAGDWVYVLDASQRIKGVYSANQGMPLKTGNFPEQYQNFESAKTYSDWKFIYIPEQ